MPLDYVMRKSAFCALILVTFLFSSCCPTCNHWKLAIIKADCPSASYVKVYLPTCNTFNGLETVLMSSNGSVRLYFNSITLLFPYYNNNEQLSEVAITIDEQEFHFIADRLEGGQCLLMPEEAMLMITGSLLEQKCVEVSVGRYQAALSPENFSKVYYSLVFCK